MIVTSASQCLNPLTAAMPAKPPPMITTCSLLLRDRESISDSLILTLLFCRHGTARAQCVHFARTEPEFFEHLLVVLSQCRGAPRRHLGDAVHLNRTADRRPQLAACTVQRNDNLIQPQLRVLNDLLRSSHGAERNVNTAEDLVPMAH